MAHRICNTCGRLDAGKVPGGRGHCKHRCNRDATICPGRMDNAVLDRATGEWRAEHGAANAPKAAVRFSKK